MAASAMRPGELGVVDGDFPAEPGDAVAQAVKDGQGWISVRTKDEWARVSIDDQRVADTPINRTPVTAGRHTVALQFSQGSSISGVFVVPVGKHVRLTAAPYRDVVNP